MIRWLLTLISLTTMIAAAVGLFGAGSPPEAFAQADTTAPTISSVAVTSDPDVDDSVYAYLYADGVYGIGDSIKVTVTFSENVTVTGSPRLELDVGGSAKTARYDSTDGSKVVFGYTVASGDNDTDGIAIGANKFTLNRGSIKDAADNTADLSHSALTAQPGHKVDGIRPTLTEVTLFANSFGSLYTEGEILNADLFISEDVVVEWSPKLRLDFQGVGKLASFLWAECNLTSTCTTSGLSSIRGDHLLFIYTVVKGDIDTDGVAFGANAVRLSGGAIKDTAGNAANLTHAAVASNPHVIVDAVPPTVSSIAITSDPGEDDTYGVVDGIEVTVTMSEDVIVRSTYPPQMGLNIGGSMKTAAFRSESAGVVVFRYVVKNGDNDADGISIEANSLTGVIEDTTGVSVGDTGNRGELSHDAITHNSGHKVVTSAPSWSTDANLSALTLSDVDFGTFASGTTSYSAQVANSVTETTVTPTVNHSGASYVIKAWRRHRCGRHGLAGSGQQRHHRRGHGRG